MGRDGSATVDQSIEGQKVEVLLTREQVDALVAGQTVTVDYDDIRRQTGGLGSTEVAQVKVKRDPSE